MSDVGLNGASTLAELDAIIAEASARKAAMYDEELARLIGEVEERCRLLGLTPRQLVGMFKKGRRGRPAKKETP